MVSRNEFIDALLIRDGNRKDKTMDKQMQARQDINSDAREALLAMLSDDELELEENKR